MRTGKKSRDKDFIIMAEVEKREAAEEEEERLMEGVAVLDFDMLCTTVAMQMNTAQMIKWNKLNVEENDEENLTSYSNGGVFRMWEGELFYDCLDDRPIALQAACCPCYRFGKNMSRAGFGFCFLQGSAYLILVLLALLNVLAYMVTKRHYFLYVAAAFTISVGAYLGYYRTQIRKKFNIRDNDSSLDDCIYHFICPCCSLCQESRTLEMNNVQDGIWHGRGDTTCIGSYSEDSKAFLELNPHPIMSTKSPDPRSISKATIDGNHSWVAEVGQTSPLV